MALKLIVKRRLRPLARERRAVENWRHLLRWRKDNAGMFAASQRNLSMALLVAWNGSAISWHGKY